MRLLEELLSAFPKDLHEQHSDDILREYLQYEMLRALYSHKLGHRLVFLGGTALRIAYDLDRFSEDLNFDNLGLSRDEFEDVLKLVQYQLGLIDYPCELKFTYKGAFHCAVRFPSLVYKYGLNPHKEAKLMIKVDTEGQDYLYTRNVMERSRFGVDVDLAAVPLSTIASMKVAAILGRRRPKGRDFYDLRWAVTRGTELDFSYLREKLNLDSPQSLHERISAHIANFNFEALAKDVAPFLVDSASAKTVSTWKDWWDSYVRR